MACGRRLGWPSNKKRVGMSLRGQFFLSVVAALVLGLSALALVACWHARASVGTEMAKALEAADQVVDNALLSLPPGDAGPYLTRLVRSFDGNRHVVVALRQGGRDVVVSHLAAADPVPGWYRALLEIAVDRRIDTAPRLEGRVLVVTTDAHNEIGEAWVQFRDGALVLGLFSLAILALLHLAMARVSAALARLGRGFEAVGAGDYDARVAAAGPREALQLATAFNRMAQRLGGLEAANRRLTGQMLAIQEEERADIARDLHDEMGPLLFAMRLDAEAVAVTAERAGNDALVAQAGRLGDAVSHIQARVRAILERLRPDGLAQTGLAAAVENLAAFWMQRQDVTVHLRLAASPCRAEVEDALYRLIQESLTNAVRHGGAQTVWIALETQGDVLRLTVEDDGRGFTQSGAPGRGLRGMRERLAALGGELVIGARAGGGTRLTASLPGMVTA